MYNSSRKYVKSTQENVILEFTSRPAIWLHNLQSLTAAPVLFLSLCSVTRQSVSSSALDFLVFLYPHEWVKSYSQIIWKLRKLDVPTVLCWVRGVRGSRLGDLSRASLLCRRKLNLPAHCTFFFQPSLRSKVLTTRWRLPAAVLALFTLSSRPERLLLAGGGNG
jgi:hypothetical protein